MVYALLISNVNVIMIPKDLWDWLAGAAVSISPVIQRLYWTEYKGSSHNNCFIYWFVALTSCALFFPIFVSAVFPGVGRHHNFYYYDAFGVLVALTFPGPKYF